MNVLKSHIRVARENAAWLRRGIWPLAFMPEHIQIAYGRGVFNLLHGVGGKFLYLRDMPMNLDALARQGHPHAFWAYRAECKRTSTEPTI